MNIFITQFPTWIGKGLFSEEGNISFVASTVWGKWVGQIFRKNQSGNYFLLIKSISLQKYIPRNRKGSETGQSGKLKKGDGKVPEGGFTLDKI